MVSPVKRPREDGEPRSSNGHAQNEAGPSVPRNSNASSAPPSSLPPSSPPQPFSSDLDGEISDIEGGIRDLDTETDGDGETGPEDEDADAEDLFDDNMIK
ncbi:hypothetical protein P389DRAFT_197504 [Cystobasidium minutum MCA 4210]|uniref:uncharacterized protein n=1 Tax=Cystobasidium minutum MCA 4210 TaxID=1397322 RepID=UPI0034CF969A|eukprot:jgi/Rhomi1/197504/gm1.5718_g